LNYYYYEGSWPQKPKFENLTPTETGVVEVPSLSPRRDKDIHHALVFEGYIDIPQDGAYTFMARSKDYLRLLLGNQELINNHKNDLRQLGVAGKLVTLRAGKHAFRIVHLDNGTTVGHPRAPFLIYYKGPGKPSFAVIPTNMFYHK
jgi:hypothetical protein